MKGILPAPVSAETDEEEKEPRRHKIGAKGCHVMRLFRSVVRRVAAPHRIEIEHFFIPARYQSGL